MGDNESTTFVSRADAARRMAVLRTDLPADRRERAARDFCTLASRVTQTSPEGVAAVASLADPTLATTAARLMASSQDPDLCRAVLAVATTVRFDEQTVRCVARALPPDETLRAAETAPMWTALDLRAGVATAYAGRAPEADAVLAGLLNGERSSWTVGMKVLLRLGDRATIRAQLVSTPPDADPPPTLTADRPTTCALFLALLGEDEGLAWLADRAKAPGPPGIAAVVRLAWLARPEAVAMVATHAGRRTVEDEAGLLLDASVALACAALAPVLAGPAFDPVRQDADAVARQITGDHASMDPTLRYRHGELLTLSHLVDDLLSPHDGPRTAAAMGLCAATGEDHGFDLALDLPANLGAIRGWRTRAAAAGVPHPGGWAWRGRPIAGPAMTGPDG